MWLNQLKAIGVTLALAVVATAILAYVVKALIGLRPTPEVERAITERIALRRYGAIAEIAESAVFLCSDSAAYITGTILDCDGGSQLGDAR